MNVVAITGRFTRDPEVKTTQSGFDVVSFSIAVDREFKSEDGERKADFIDCVAWRKTAEFIGKYFSKGSKIEIQGKIQTRNWEDESGTRRYATEVLVERCGFAESRKASGSAEPEQTAKASGVPSGFFPAVDDDTTLPFDL